MGSEHTYVHTNVVFILVLTVHVQEEKQENALTRSGQDALCPVTHAGCAYATVAAPPSLHGREINWTSCTLSLWVCLVSRKGVKKSIVARFDFIW
jgi:hypothetical protein